MKTIKITDINYPKRLKEIKNPPKQLYIEGDEKLLNNKSIAIVGSRNCTNYGIKYAEEFAKELSKNNITIVSGLAIGIDTVAHEFSKDYKGKTIAVLGSGLDIIYPKENKELYKKILENGGCIISEYEKGIKIDSKNFPKRNRIVSGISLGILVIEAAYKSGSTITARLGFEQSKKVFCLPRNLGEVKGRGTNELIKKGAILVTDPKDILKELEIKIEDVEDDKNIERIDLERFNKEKIIDEEYIELYNFIRILSNKYRKFIKKK